MKKIGVIPARYGSTRFKGKPLAKIFGKPMVWWVYKQALKANLDEVYVATDDEKVMKACEQYNISSIMTLASHKTPNDRVFEVSQKVQGDIYVCINGDEPLIEPFTIDAVLPKEGEDITLYYANVITEIKNPVEVIDPTNIKVVVNEKGEAIWASRSPIPYPKGNMEFKYKKIVGVAAFSRDALQYYVDTPRSRIETIEELDLYRFLENHKTVQLKEVNCSTLSVDTPKDLEYVKGMIKQKTYRENFIE